MTPTGPLCNCWMMPEDTLQRWKNKAREQPESEAALLAGKKLFLWRSVELTGQALSSLLVSVFIMLLGNACTSELLWIAESVQTLCYLLFVSFTYIYMYIYILSNCNFLRIFFLVEFSCEVFLSNYIKYIDRYQSPFFIPFLYGELQTPEIIWSLHLMGEDWRVFLGSQAEFWLPPFL